MIDPAAFTTVFDVTRVRSDLWLGSAFGLVFMTAGTGMVLYELRWRSVPDKSRRLFAWFVLALTSLWTAAISIGTYAEYGRLAGAVRAGRVSYVEGPVANFVPLPVGGHGMEHFEVAGKRFEYSDSVLTVGFNSTARHGGPIRAGRFVRVGYVRDTVVQLAVLP